MTINHSKLGTMAALAAIKKKSGFKNIDNHKEINSEKSAVSNNEIIEINPDYICNWHFHDRQSFELGDIKELSEDLKNNGQQQPIIVRPYKDNKFKYEVIAGERRWRAAKLAQISVLAVVKNLSEEEAAFCQISENSNRKSLSDFSIGINYKTLIEQGVVSQKQLEERLNKSKTSISELLSFSDLPKEIIAAINDMSKVSARTSATIRAYINKNKKFKQLIINLAPQIRKGLGATKLHKLLRTEEEEKTPNKKNKLKKSKEFKNQNGVLLFTSKQDNNSRSLVFNKNILKKINFDNLEEKIKEFLETQLQNLVRSCEQKNK